MNDINAVTIVGRLTRDAELKYTSGGYPILTFSLASNYSRKVGDEWKEEASFFDVKVLGKMGESVSKYLEKAKQVMIQGALRQERWETSEGDMRSRVLVLADRVQFVGAKGDARPTAPTADDVAPWEKPPEATSELDFVDDVPF